MLLLYRAAILPRCRFTGLPFTDTGYIHMFAPPKYRRVLLKLSGEILAGDRGFGIDPDIVKQLVNEIINVQELGIQIGIVIGGGNIMRGAQAGPGNGSGVGRLYGNAWDCD